jgi:hypothetical protein
MTGVHALLAQGGEEAAVLGGEILVGAEGGIERWERRGEEEEEQGLAIGERRQLPHTALLRARLFKHGKGPPHMVEQLMEAVAGGAFDALASGHGGGVVAKTFRADKRMLGEKRERGALRAPFAADLMPRVLT